MPRGRSARCNRAPVSGLLNWIGVGRSLVLPSGHSGWYGTLSKPGAPPGLKQPLTWTKVDHDFGKQYVSSESAGSWSLTTPSIPVQFPPGAETLVHRSKWPVSSAKAMLYECAAHGTRVFSDDVLYIG